MKILLIASAYNGLTQRTHVELSQRRHTVSIALALSADGMRRAVRDFSPDLILCPFLKEKIPNDIWKQHICIIIHPGILGDRGPSSLDWAITRRVQEWGVTALQADEEMDAGDIWATANFPVRQASKASIYRREVSQTAIQLILETLEKIQDSNFQPTPISDNDPNIHGKLQPAMKQTEREIDWLLDSTETILDKINAADSSPGVKDVILGKNYFLFGAHLEDQLKGETPGDIIATRCGAICRATIDGAIWISHLRRPQETKVPFSQRWKVSEDPRFKLPAAVMLGKAVDHINEVSIDPLYSAKENTFKEIWYEEHNDVGYLHFNFHNGAMSTDQCCRLLATYRLACQRPTRVIFLMGGTDFWSNGIHLSRIEAAKDPASESWININAIDDVVYEIITTMSHLVVSALYGNAGAGGAIMPLAADFVIARAACVLNPHYKTMGLFGSEYWTYLLPRRVGPSKAQSMMENPLPIGMQEAKQLGMVDSILPDDETHYRQSVGKFAEELAHCSRYAEKLSQKKALRGKDEAVKSLSSYNAAELKEMKLNFSGKSFSGTQRYDEARYNFVYKRGS